MGPDGGSQNSNTPPPFLTKTYDMVDDPTTDETVSWSGTGATFVVWNAADFSRDLLPQYFKHNNFSSFVRQLNTYGFRKINPDRWEFATEGFSRGNKDALKNIHRRKPSASSHSSSQAHHVEHLQLQQLQPESVRCTDPAHSELQEEIKKMQQDKKVLLVELTNLRQEQKTTEMDLQDLGQRLQVLEERQQQILSFLARAVWNPRFLAQFVQQETESMTFNKKRRFPFLVGTGESGDDDKHPVGSITAGKDISGTWQNYSETISRANISCEGILRQLSISTLNQSDGNSPISHSSGVNLREIHTLTMYPDTPANDVSGQSVPEATVPQVRNARCSGEITGQSSQKGESRDNTLALDINVSNELEPLLPWSPQSSHKKTSKKAAKGSGSNDGFWEKYLTESPSSTDTESDLETDDIIKTKEVCLKDSFC